MNIVEPASKPHRIIAPISVMVMKQKATGSPVDIQNNRPPITKHRTKIALGSIDICPSLRVHDTFSFNQVAMSHSEKPQGQYKTAHKN